MQVTIKRFDKDLPLPEYKTPGAIAVDCVARVDVTVPPKGMGLIPLNVAIKPPEGYFVLMAPRSSLHKRGLFLGNSIGLFDEDFCGDGDEYHASVYNYTDELVEVKRGDRITQLVVLPYDKVEWVEVETMSDPTRGGFGSTGKN